MQVPLKSLPCLNETFFLADLLDEGHRESVPGDNAVVHQLHKGRQSEGQQVAETKRRRTHRDTHRKLLCGRWPEAVSRCNAQMAQNITGNERSAEARGWGGGQEEERGQRIMGVVLQPGLL